MPNFNLTAEGSGLRCIVGHVGKEPVERFTQGGKKVVSFTVATNRKDKAGNVTTDWHSIVCWDENADAAMNLHKGQVAFVIGPAKTRTYQDREFADIIAWALGVGFPPQRSGQHEPLPPESKGGAHKSPPATQPMDRDQEIPF